MVTAETGGYTGRVLTVEVRDRGQIWVAKSPQCPEAGYGDSANKALFDLIDQYAKRLGADPEFRGRIGDVRDNLKRQPALSTRAAWDEVTGRAVCYAELAIDKIGDETA